jgi:hypothetical protein
MKITDAYIKTNLRKIFLMSNQRTEVVNRCKVSRGVYRCEKCGKTLKRNEIKVHHIKAVADVDWNTYINKLFCGIESLLGICRVCHDEIHKNK